MGRGASCAAGVRDPRDDASSWQDFIVIRQRWKVSASEAPAVPYVSRTQHAHLAAGGAWPHSA